jgi:threonine/homoserine/homoserine lactone efflux protein
MTIPNPEPDKRRSLPENTYDLIRATIGECRQAYCTEIGIMTGFAVGLTYAVTQLGAGVAEPATFWDAARWGGKTFVAVRNRLRG